jgi:hypothetical protein
MHDTWLGGYPDESGKPAPVARHRTRAHGKGAETEFEEYEPEVIEGFAERVGALGYMINSIVFNVGPPLHKNFHVVDGVLQRVPGSVETSLGAWRR